MFRIFLSLFDILLLTIAWWMEFIEKNVRFVYDDSYTMLPLQEGVGPDGSRGARVVWVLNMKYLLVSGFNK